MAKKKTKIKRFGVLSVGKIAGLMYAIFGIIAALFFLVYMVFISLLGLAVTDSKMMLLPFAFGGVFFIILLPIIYGVLGFVFGCITALLYNFLAARVGGIKVETE